MEKATYSLSCLCRWPSADSLLVNRENECDSSVSAAWNGPISIRRVGVANSDTAPYSHSQPMKLTLDRCCSVLIGAPFLSSGFGMSGWWT